MTRVLQKDMMKLPVLCQPILRVDSHSSTQAPTGVSLCGLGPDLVALLAGGTRPDLLKCIFRVRLAQTLWQEDGSLPDVAGRYLLHDDEVAFIPTFPFEHGVKYRAIFDPRPLGSAPAEKLVELEFLIPCLKAPALLTEVTHIYPSYDLLPENVLRFYVCFSNSMQRGRAQQEISLLDSDGQVVVDALYRPPVELWDRSMRHLTVLLDPGRLKWWVGPNIELGPPLKAGQQYTLEIGSGMIDAYGRPLRECLRKQFLAGEPVRQPISIESWRVLPPTTGSREPLVLMFPGPLDWALLLQTITVARAEGSEVDGRITVDQSERRWSFVPASPWSAGDYHIRVGSGLEDVCGNSMTGPFDRPLRKDKEFIATRSSLNFQLI